VDDAYDYGSIAAANSLSDIYAMGGSPFLALNIAALPENLPLELSANILRGGAEKAREAGVVIAGGHTVKDEEPKYGLVVIGFVDPAKIISKGGLKVGDQLVLTKPLGFGVTTTALKREQVDADDLAEAVSWMKRLNKSASELAVQLNVRGGTDITGYSLLGHGLEMAKESNAALYIDYTKIPFISGASKYAGKGCFASGAFDNRSFYKPNVNFNRALSEPEEMLIFDPQTSGGLLLGVPAEKLDEFMESAKKIQEPVWHIGEVKLGNGITVV